jgi:hypothetical protein
MDSKDFISGIGSCKRLWIGVPTVLPNKRAVFSNLLRARISDDAITEMAIAVILIKGS